jgi:tRNA A37 threonylcarbamoyladenosine biosynthesis protein TsaE
MRRQFANCPSQPPPCAGPPIHHFDLYRLNGALDLQRIGWAQSLQTAVCLVEWPGVLGDHLPSERLDICIAVAAEVLVRSLTHVASRVASHDGAAGRQAGSSYGVPM